MPGQPGLQAAVSVDARFGPSLTAVAQISSPSCSTQAGLRRAPSTEEGKMHGYHQSSIKSLSHDFLSYSFF